MQFTFHVRMHSVFVGLAARWRCSCHGIFARLPAYPEFETFLKTLGVHLRAL